MPTAFLLCLSSGLCRWLWYHPFLVFHPNQEPYSFRCLFPFSRICSPFSVLHCRYYLLPSVVLYSASAYNLPLGILGFNLIIFCRSHFIFFRCKVRLHRCVPSTSRSSLFLLKISAAFRIFLLNGSPITKCGFPKF